MLRRLSRAEDAVFCGRVYIFLFQSFPLGDRSSVNLRGDFHIENVTTFEEYFRSGEAEDDSMDVDADDTDRPNENDTQSREQESKPVRERGRPERDGKRCGDKNTAERKVPTLDLDALYPVFWSLQLAFSNPPRLFEDANFKGFQKGLEATLAKFKEVPKVTQTSDLEGKRGVTQRSGDDHNGLANAFNPKYLTSRDLFKLEVG